MLDRYGAPLRRRLNAASRLLSTLELRGLNQQVIDGRLPEAVGGEFADANGLGGPHRRRSGPVIRIGYQAFDENQTLAHLYAEALRGDGFRVRVRAPACARRRSPRCAEGGSTCGPATRGRCSAISAAARSRPRCAGSAPARCAAHPPRTATRSR